MELSVEARTQRLLQISIDLRNQMAELRKLNETVLTAEATQRTQAPVHPAVTAPLAA
jgi:hypothetical protein